MQVPPPQKPAGSKSGQFFPEMRKRTLVVWIAVVVVSFLVIGFIWWNHRELYSAVSEGPINRAQTYGMGKYVSDIRLGWCNNNGEPIEQNLFTDSLSVTLF